MNPLDPAELQHFVTRKLNEEMPIHTETTAKIKRSYSQGMPKNLMEYSAHVDNKFLNDNLAIIEEIAHRDQKHPIPKWFRDYQIKHFAKYGILKADGFFVRDRFFGQIFPREIYYGAGANYHNIGVLSVIGNTKVPGIEAETDGPTDSSSNSGADQLEAAKTTSATALGWYNQMKWNIITAAGTIRVGVWDDSASAPDALLADSGNQTPAADYTTIYPVAEFQAPASTIWLGHNQNNAGLVWDIWTALGKYKGSVTLGALPNPFGTPTGNNNAAKLKVSHS